MDWFRRNYRDVLSSLVIIGLLLAVNLLPPDTALQQVRKSGVLRVCVPSSYPPLVTGNPAKPGIDIEILREVAEQLDVRLLPVTNANMGRDFNPRNWRVNRAQCAVLAGGVVASEMTRSFLDTTTPYLETGWALVAPELPASLKGLTVGFHAGVSGLDRIALSRYLRAQGADVQIMNTVAALEAALESGTAAAGVTEAIQASQLAGTHDWQVSWLSEELPRESLTFGLWKGDLTLKRALQHALQQLERSGRLQDILDGYDVGTLEEVAYR
jgi:polar amino acid transport system substrate-binding protein/cystine transport system substrate-binding protein/membrane-bound lytic murein transglycosylase F